MYQQQAYAKTTYSSYQSGIRCYLNFLAMSGRMSTHTSSTSDIESTLIHFVTHCASNLQVCHTTIKCYLAGVRYYFISNGLRNPFNDATQPLHLLELTLKGIRRSQTSHISRTRLPVTTPVLHSICSILDTGFHSPYLDALLKAACTLAFFGFLRCSEFTTRTKSFDATVHLCLTDIVFHCHHGLPTEFHLHLKESKTDPFRQGTTILISAVQGIICPVRAMSRYLTARRPLDTDPFSPLFLLPLSHQALDRHTFITHFRQVLDHTAYDASLYSGHSFRSGGATTSSAARVPDHLIQTLGRWSSQAYRLYIHTPPDTIRRAQRALAAITHRDLH